MKPARKRKPRKFTKAEIESIWRALEPRVRKLARRKRYVARPSDYRGCC